MKPVAAVAVVLIACGGTNEPVRDHAPEAVAKPVAPPPERDCTVLVPAIERITANEVAELFRTRAIEVARIAAADLERVAPTLREVMPARCTTDAWSGAYTACMTTATLRADAQACQVHLTQDQLDRLAAEIASRTPTSPYGDLPAECQEMIGLMQRMMQCPQMQQMGQPFQQQMQQSIDQMVTGWKQAIATPDGARATADACRTARDSLKQSFTAMGCPI